MQLNINKTGNTNMPEVGISGDSQNYKLLSSYFESQTSLEIPLTEKQSDFYPIVVSRLILKPVEESEGLLKLRLEDNFLEIAGDKKAFLTFAQTLLNLSDTKPGRHFQIDYYEGNGIVGTTNISLTLNLTE